MRKKLKTIKAWGVFPPYGEEIAGLYASAKAVYYSEAAALASIEYNHKLDRIAGRRLKKTAKCRALPITITYKL